MKVYLGQTRAAKWIRRCNEHGFGEMTVRGELPPRRRPWAYDNGAFRDWKAERAFNMVQFTRDLWTIRNQSLRPDFVVLPDVPGNAAATIDMCHEWLDWTRQSLGDACPPLYFALQDGLSVAQARELLDQVDGLFVGGTLEWKLRTGEQWVALAHEYGRQCHVGRVGTFDRVRWAQRVGVDSIDSCLPLFSEGQFTRFCEAVGSCDPQQELY